MDRPLLLGLILILGVGIVGTPFLLLGVTRMMHVPDYEGFEASDIGPIS